MDRRLIGALLVITVLAAATTVPLLGGRRTSGTASMVDLPRDPRPGDCLLERPAGVDAASIGRRPSQDAEQSPPAPEIGPLGPTVVPCDSAAVSGQVILTISATGTPAERERAVVDSGINCRSAALKFTGLTSVAAATPAAGAPPVEPMRQAGLPLDRAADGSVTWTMTVNVRTTWIHPSPLLRASGRSWAACVAAPPLDVRYRGSLFGALSGGRLPDEFATCWNAPTVSASIEPIDCGQPHFSELLSAGVIPDRSKVSTVDLHASCTRLAVAATGRADPTDGGRLRIRTAPEQMFYAGIGPSVSVLCYLTTADRPLTGTLIGLHERPVPFAN